MATKDVAHRKRAAPPTMNHSQTRGYTMSALGVAELDAPTAGIRALICRHPATAFLIMAFAFGWTTLLPLLLSQRGVGVLPIDLPVTVFQFLASFVGLTLPAFLVAAATGGKAGVRDLLHHALRWRVGVQWYLIALLIMWLYNGTGGSLLIVALFHSAFNMSTGQKITPELLVGANATVLNLFVWATAAVVAVLVAAFTRGRLGYKRTPA